VKETVGLSYVDLKGAVLKGLRGRQVGLTGVIENWEEKAVEWRHFAVF